ncbi:MAG: sulfite exporter TauE/SafE family protein [Aeromonas sp.]
MSPLAEWLSGLSSDLVSAFFIGLAGAGHCLSMCGPLAGSLTLTLPPKARSLWARLPFIAAYQGGRLLSYGLAGAIVGGLLASSLQLAEQQAALMALKGLAIGVMLLIALYLLTGWPGFIWLERWGGRLWPRLKPLAARCLPLRSPWRALPLGFIWGWLPCGLVYSMLTWSATSGSALAGAMIMLSFSLGTLPALLAMTGLADSLRFWLAKPIWRQLTGAGLLLYTATSLWGLLAR